MFKLIRSILALIGVIAVGVSVRYAAAQVLVYSHNSNARQYAFAVHNFFELFAMPLRALSARLLGIRNKMEFGLLHWCSRTVQSLRSPVAAWSLNFWKRKTKLRGERFSEVI